MKQFARRVYAGLPFKRQAYAFLRQKLGITPPFFEHLHFTGPCEIQMEGDQRFKVYSAGNVVENELFWLGFGNGWEGLSLKLWHRICAGQAGTILDIGANSGIYALAAAAVAPQAKVIAFEPIARVAEHLSRNVDLNRFPIQIERCAVSDRDGTTIIFDVVDDYNYSASLEGQGPEAQPIEVPVCTIDAYLAASSSGPVAAVKIDVERHEPAVIAGMKRTLAKDGPPILIEILDSQIGTAVAERISGLGYLMFHIVENKGLVPTQTLCPLSGHDWNHLLCTQANFDRLELAGFLAA